MIFYLKIIFLLIILISFSAFSSVLDPGVKGLKPPMGIDTDKNGVRDDLQFWIDEIFTGQNEKLGSLQLARAILKSMIDYKDKNKTILNTQNIFKAQNCLLSIYEKDVALKNIKNIHSRMINTRDRKIIQERLDSHLKNHTFEAIQANEKDCDFKKLGS